MEHWHNKSLADIEGEIWKPVEGFESRYLVSNKGRVKSLGSSHNTGHNIVLHHEKIRSISLDSDGYCFLNFSVKNKSFPQKVHRLVAKAFVPNPNNLETVNHIDFNRTNNSAENLSWESERDNYYYSVKSGRMKNNGRNLPEMSRQLFSKKVVKLNLDGSFVAEYNSINEAARINNILSTCIVANLKGKSKTSYGYVWQYKEPQPA